MSLSAPSFVIAVSLLVSLAKTFAEDHVISSTTSGHFNYRIPESLGDDLGTMNSFHEDESGSSSTVHHNTRHRHHNGKFSVNNDRNKNHNNYDNSHNRGDNQIEEPDDPLLIERLDESEKLRNKFKHKFNFSWPVRESASVEEGEIVLGALHMIHERSEEYVCGKVMDQGGIQALEAMLYTLDHVNGKFGPMLIPGVRIGVLAKDDCDTDIFGLEQALDFIRGE